MFLQPLIFCWEVTGEKQHLNRAFCGRWSWGVATSRIKSHLLSRQDLLARDGLVLFTQVI